MNTGIVLKQKPIIEHDLKNVGLEVTKRLQIINVNGQVVTSETIQALKKLRSELNKEFANYESQRKLIKAGVNSPYLEFENEYKSEISVKYTDAISVLKTKIGEYEIKLKEDISKNLQSYFTELCTSENIDFVNFEQVGLDINLSTSDKKYKEQCNTFIERIKDDILLIESQEHDVEILVEFKKTLNASKAITDVITRKKDEEKINALKSDKLNEQNQFTNQSEPDLFNNQPKTNQLKAPEKVKKQKIVKAKFEVSGTLNELKELGVYMKEKGLTYKNI